MTAELSTLAAASPLPPLTGEAWEDIALLRQNKEIDDDVVDAALRDHAAHLSIEEGRYAVEELRDALLRLQKAEDPSTVLDVELIGPDHTPETYVNACRGFVEDATARLTGAQK